MTQFRYNNKVVCIDYRNRRKNKYALVSKTFKIKKNYRQLARIIIIIVFVEMYKNRRICLQKTTFTDHDQLTPISPAKSFSPGDVKSGQTCDNG